MKFGHFLSIFMSVTVKAQNSTIVVNPRGRQSQLRIFAADTNLSKPSAMDQAKVTADKICRSLDFEKATQAQIERGSFNDDDRSWTTSPKQDYVTVSDDLTLEKKSLELPKKIRFTNPIVAILTSAVAYKRDTIEHKYQQHYYFTSLECSGLSNTLTPEQIKKRKILVNESNYTFGSKFAEKFWPPIEKVACFSNEDKRSLMTLRQKAENAKIENFGCEARGDCLDSQDRYQFVDLEGREKLASLRSEVIESRKQNLDCLDTAISDRSRLGSTKITLLVDLEKCFAGACTQSSSGDNPVPAT